MRPTAIAICQQLQNAGHEALFAGGAVRDLLLGQTPTDIDIATSARPEAVEDLFEKSYAIGKKFGVILIEKDGHHFEIATFRSDSGESDGRRPKAVFFSDKKEDALRRDFTVNALFWDPVADKLYDYVGGVNDLKAQTLRFVGDPEARINEDFLRILRAVRFKNALGFAYAPGLEAALSKHASLTGQITAERVRAELEKMLISPQRVGSLGDLDRLGILRVVLPEVAALGETPDADRDRSVFAHTLECLRFLPANADAILAWSVLLHDTGKAVTLTRESDRNHFHEHERASEQIAKTIGLRFKFSRFETQKIAWLVRQHIPFYQIPQMTRAHRLRFYDHPFFTDLIEVCRADALGDDGNAAPVDAIETDYHDSRERKLLPQFHPELLTGAEIMALTGLPAGATIGRLKHELREKQLLGEIGTKKEAERFLAHFRDQTGSGNR